MDRSSRIEEELHHSAAEFINRESNRSSLITVTRAMLSKDLASAKIMISVFPEAKEEEALHFLKRIRGDFRDYLKKTTKLARFPVIDFVLDEGEKNRQHLESLS